MSGVPRYILWQLLGPTVFVTVTLTGVIWLTQSLRFLDLIINRGLSAGDFFYLTLLLLPKILVLLLPISLFSATVYIYHRLKTDSEIVVMRAVGLSPGIARISGPYRIGRCDGSLLCAHAILAAPWISYLQGLAVLVQVELRVGPRARRCFQHACRRGYRFYSRARAEWRAHGNPRARCT